MVSETALEENPSYNCTQPEQQSVRRKKRNQLHPPRTTECEKEEEK
jgi:hypothetical protein